MIKYVNIREYSGVHMCTYASSRIYSGMHVCMYVRICIFVCTYVYVPTFRCLHSCILAFIYNHARKLSTPVFLTPQMPPSPASLPACLSVAILWI